jgi:hypothetical protein
MAEKIADAWREVRRFNRRFTARHLPASIFERTVAIEGGTATTIILDNHPLRAAR